MYLIFTRKLILKSIEKEKAKSLICKNKALFYCYSLHKDLSMFIDFALVIYLVVDINLSKPLQSLFK